MLKRAFDIVVSATALVVLCPLIALVALIVRLESLGPVFFRQSRVGMGDKRFTMIKFRTMQPDEGGRQEIVVPEVSDFREYVFDPLEGGRRYTRIGEFLRATSLDELPNLWNVLRGDMSIVGPRPEVPELVAQYLPEFHRRHSVRPGITGLAQVSGRGSLTYEETIHYDLQYVDDHSFVRDLAILVRTIPAVLSRRGAR